MKILKKVNCIVKGKEIEINTGINKGEKGIIIKICGYVPDGGCIFHILINNVICEYSAKFFKWTDSEMAEYWENDNDDEFEIED